MYLRKTLFEEFWNDKSFKEKELKLKMQEMEDLTDKLAKKQKQAEKQQNRQTDLKVKSEVHEKLTESIQMTEMRIKRNENKKSQLLEEQKVITSEIYKLDLLKNERRKVFQKMMNEKNVKKMQENKKMHETKELDLRIKFFIDKILEKNHINRTELLKISLKKGDLDNIEQDMGGSGRYSTPEMYEMHSNLPLTRSELSNFDRKKRNFNKKKKKNVKLDAEVTCGSTCKNACVIF